MRKSLTSIVCVGVVAMIFLSVMSAIYLSHLPTKEDLANLEDHLRREHGLYLSVAAPVQATFVSAEEEDGPGGIKIRCTLRRDLEKQPAVVDIHLKRIAESVLEHPEWRVYVQYVTVKHVGARTNRAVTRVREKEPARP